MRSPRNATFSIRRLRTSLSPSSFRSSSPDSSSSSRRGISPSGSTKSTSSSIAELIMMRRQHSAIDIAAVEEQQQFGAEMSIFEQRPTFERGVGTEVPGIFEVLEGRYQRL